MLEEKVSMMAEWERVWPLRAIVRSGSASAWRLVAENVVEVFNAGMPLKKHSHSSILHVHCSFLRPLQLFDHAESAV